MSNQKAPIVAIVGRANVGKSSLFNAILKKREAIVANEPGTTRDPVWAKTTYKDHDFWLVDTAGIKDPEDEFEFTIQEQISQAADSADVIWVVIDATVTIGAEDRAVAKMALKTKKPVMLLANKSDKRTPQSVEDFQKLGIKTIIKTSATQNGGIVELLEKLTVSIPKIKSKEHEDKIHVALLGRPNVGKSHLFNTLLNKQQAIVANVAGTTRDVNKQSVRFNQKEIILMDTAGIRRSGKIARGVERFSVIRTIAAIEQADVCLLLLDANEHGTALDQKIAGMIKEAGKGLVLVISKWDSIDKDAFTRDILAKQIQSTFDFVPWAPLIFTSAVSGQNVAKLFEIVLDITDRRTKIIKTTELNRWLKKVTDAHTPAGLKNTYPKLQYIVQEDNTFPNFKVFGSNIRLVHWSYKRFMERKLREAYGFEGTPIKFWFIENKK